MGQTPIRRRITASAAALIASAYLAASVTWILLSDQFLHLTISDTDLLTSIQSVKGLAFVAVTSAVLYLVTRLYLGRAAATNENLLESYDDTLAGWAAALDIRDRSTGQHTERVTTRTVALARSLGIPAEDLEHIRRGATLHDIGKMGVPDSILGKTGPLDEDEWRQMKRHPELAVAMLTGIDYLRPALDIPWCHHERWDGSGYPRGLSGTDIPIAARLFAVVDVFDALTSERPYREPVSEDVALRFIESRSGTHFDPQAVDAFCTMMRVEPLDSPSA
jgi:putative nucleotidyltransferase with HDIG domain